MTPDDAPMLRNGLWIKAAGIKVVFKNGDYNEAWTWDAEDPLYVMRTGTYIHVIYNNMRKLTRNSHSGIETYNMYLIRSFIITALEDIDLSMNEKKEEIKTEDLTPKEPEPTPEPEPEPEPLPWWRRIFRR